MKKLQNIYKITKMAVVAIFASILIAPMAIAAIPDIKPLALDGCNITAINSDSTGNNIIVGGLDKNQIPALFYSQDGKTFIEIALDASQTGSSINALNIINKTILLGTNNGLFTVAMDGALQRQNNIQGAVNVIKIVNNQTILIGTVQGLYISTDGGQNFALNTSVADDSGNANVTGIAIANNTIYVAFAGFSSDISHMGYGAFVDSASVNGLDASTKFSNTVFYQEYGMENPIVNNIFIDPAHGNKINLAVNQTMVQCTQNGDCSIIKSLPQANYLSCSQDSSNNVYCASDLGLWMSQDGLKFTNITAGQHLFYTNNGQNFYGQSLYSNGKNLYAGFINASGVGEGIFEI